jgi:hypothetical protein
MENPNSIPPKLSEALSVAPKGAGQHCWDGIERRKDVLTLMQDIYRRLDQQDHMMLTFHDEFIVHLSETKATKDLLNELLELYTGSKFMITVFKFFLPIVAAIAAAVLWVKEHLK